MRKRISRLSDEEKKEHRRLCQQKYRESEKGRKRTLEAVKRYQKTEKYIQKQEEKKNTLIY